MLAWSDCGAGLRGVSTESLSREVKEEEEEELGDGLVLDLPSDGFGRLEGKSESRNCRVASR